MAEEKEQSGAPTEGAPQLNDAEKAAIEVGQRGLSETSNDFTPQGSGPQRPDYVPEKFWKDGKIDVEAMAKSYGELEKTRSQAPAATEEKPKEETPAAEVKPDGKIEKTAEEQAAEAAEAAANPNPALATAMETARTEWAEKQEVTEDTIKALETAGIPREVFNLYIEGVKAQQAQLLTTIHGYVGGEDNYKQMAAWAGQNLSDKELGAFNSSLDNPDLRENAVAGLYARYSKARPSEGRMIAPTGGQAAGGDVYTDRDQLVADQKNPKYQTDPAFRDQVMQKLARSQAGGFHMVQRSPFEKRVLSN